MVQHGRDLSIYYLVQIYPEVIYSPFFDSLLEFPKIPQLITCHDRLLSDTQFS